MNPADQPPAPRPGEPSVEQLRTAMRLAVEDVTRRVPAPEAVVRLTEVGLDPQTAAAVYGQVRQAVVTTQRRTAKILLLSGAFWMAACAAALLIGRFIWPAQWHNLWRAVALLAGIAGVQIATGCWRWRRAGRL